MHLKRLFIPALAVCAAVLSLAPAGAGSAGPFPRAGVIFSSKLVVRSGPSTTARSLYVLRQFRRDFRPTEILAVGETQDAAGRTWLKLSLPVRPNNRYGWVRSDLVDVHPVYKQIVIARGSRVLSLYDHEKLVFRTRVAVGRPGMETPLGSFYIQARYKATEPALGAYAFETTAWSKLSDWPGGGVIGIHGTPMPQLLGKAVSHGCIRVSNAAALTLKRLAPVGTPIKVVR
jgi:lipoprotein-anchoring transpeptidase ErfK/SrfK